METPVLQKSYDNLIENLSESRVCKIHSRLLERLKDRFRV